MTHNPLDAIDDNILLEFIDGPLIFGFGDVLSASCDSKKSKKNGECYNGSSKFSGCGDDCAIAVASGFNLLLTDELHFSGQVVDFETGDPIPEVKVHVALPGTKRFGTRTQKDGTFMLHIKPTAKNAPESKPHTVDLGVLKTSAKDEEREPITIVMHFTKEFRKKHPHIQFGHVLVDDLKNEVVYLNYHQ